MKHRRRQADAPTIRFCLSHPFFFSPRAASFPTLPILFSNHKHRTKSSGGTAGKKKGQRRARGRNKGKTSAKASSTTTPRHTSPLRTLSLLSKKKKKKKQCPPGPPPQARRLRRRLRRRRRLLGGVEGQVLTAGPAEGALGRGACRNPRDLLFPLFLAGVRRSLGSSRGSRHRRRRRRRLLLPRRGPGRALRAPLCHLGGRLGDLARRGPGSRARRHLEGGLQRDAAGGRTAFTGGPRPDLPRRRASARRGCSTLRPSIGLSELALGDAPRPRVHRFGGAVRRPPGQGGLDAPSRRLEGGRDRCGAGLHRLLCDGRGEDGREGGGERGEGARER